MEKKNGVKICKSNITGEHEWAFHAERGEECKHCGVPRSKLEEATGQSLVSPFQMDAFGQVREVGEPRTVPIISVPSPEQIEQIVARMEEKHLSDETFNRILQETHSKAAIVITFDKPIVESRFTLTDFHIAVANVVYRNVQPILTIILEALRGRLGGTMKLKREGEEPPAVT